MDAALINQISLILSISQFFICSAGLAMNSFLAFSIVKNKNLLSSCCGFFIFLLAIEDAICEFSLITLQFFPSFIGPIPILHCLLLEWIGPLLQPNIQILMLAISYDRLISVLFHIGYKRITKHKVKYIFTVTALPGIGTLYLLYIWYKYANENKEMMVLCSPSAFMDSTSLFIVTTIQIFSNIGMIFNYFFILALIKCKVVKIVHNSVEQRLLRTLFILMAVTVLCWLPFPIVNNFLLFYFKFPPNLQAFAVRVGIFPNKIAQTFNPPILYFCSSDYRQAMQKEFQKIFKKFVNGNGNENNQTRLNLNSISSIKTFTPLNNNFIN